MTRKDSEKDSERPHYYSQFWLDVAAGRRVIGAPRPNEEADTLEPELSEHAVLRKAGRNNADDSDGYEETIAHPEVEPAATAEEYIEPEAEELDMINDVDDTDIPNIEVDDTEIPDMDLAPIEEEEEEEEEDVGWGGVRGRKKPKPGRQAKQPPKRIKREPRRGGY